MKFLMELVRNAEGGAGGGTGGGGDNGGTSGGGAGDNGGNNGTGGGAGGGGKDGQGAPWYSTIPGIGDNADFKAMADKYTSVEAAVKAGFNAQRMIGYEKIPIPKAEADWENWYNAAGRPKDAASYDLKKPENLPEGFAYDDKLEQAFRDVAHKNGLNTKQAAAFRDWWVETMAGQYTSSTKAMADERARGEDALKREYGQSYDGFVAQSQAAMKEFMDPTFVQFLEQSGLGNHPEMVKTFGKIGKVMVGEGKIKVPDNQNTGVSHADLDRQIADFRSTNFQALTNMQHPDNKRFAAELEGLYKKRYG